MIIKEEDNKYQCYKADFPLQNTLAKKKFQKGVTKFRLYVNKTYI